MSKYHLSQLNIADLLAPLDSPQLANFVANLEPINALAEASPGFVWRLQTEEGDATSIDYFGPDKLVNLSLWETVEDLKHYVYRSAHTDIMRRRREWFGKMDKAHMVLWWVAAGHIPSVEEAAARLAQLQQQGPTQQAFSFTSPFPPPQ